MRCFMNQESTWSENACPKVLPIGRSSPQEPGTGCPCEADEPCESRPSRRNPSADFLSWAQWLSDAPNLVKAAQLITGTLAPFTSTRFLKDSKDSGLGWVLLYYIHSRKRTWTLRMAPSKTVFLYKPVAFRVHISFPSGVIMRKRKHGARLGVYSVGTLHDHWWACCQCTYLNLALHAGVRDGTGSARQPPTKNNISWQKVLAKRPWAIKAKAVWHFDSNDWLAFWHGASDLSFFCRHVQVVWLRRFTFGSCAHECACIPSVYVILSCRTWKGADPNRQVL